MAHARIVINEIHYNPPGGDDLTEFIEFWNVGVTSVSMAGWYMQDGVDYVFPAGARIAPGGFLLLVKDRAAFAFEYPGVTNVYGPFANGTGLNNTGERIALADNTGVIVSEVTYADRAPWPPEADGGGSSLELRHPAAPSGAAWNWAASPLYGGSPGATNTAFAGMPGIIDLGPSPAYPAGGQPVTISAFVAAPTTVAALVCVYTTNFISSNGASMYDDGLHGDGAAGDGIFAGIIPGVPEGTYVRYYYQLTLATGATIEMPEVVEVQPALPGLTARLSYSGLLTDVVPEHDWRVATTTGQATSSRVYMYLSSAGQVQLDDISITLGGTQHIVNGTFGTDVSNWSLTGNHSNSYHDSAHGYTAPGCLTLVASAPGGSWGNSLNCYTSPSLIDNGPQYVLSFAYRLAPTNSRAWLRYYTGSTNWHWLRINEVMPYNTSVRTDSDGEYSDWFELVNSGSAPLNLSDCGVSDDTDNPMQWRLSDVLLAPGQHLLVWASGKDRTAGELHTNFRLAAGGETLILTDAHGVRIDQITWGALPPDISYGRLPDASTSLVYFSAPTPGAANQPPGFSAIAATPRVSRPGGLFLGTLVLTLSVDSAQAEIRYTLDGTTPHTNSARYTAPLTRSATTRLRARAFEPGLLPSAVVQHEYYRVIPGILTSTPLPIVVIDTRGQGIPNEPKIAAYMGIISNGAARNAVADPFSHFEGLIGIEVRGQSSQSEPQQQYAIETRGDDGEDRNVALLGFPPESDWVLYAPYNDKTLMRNVLAYDAANRMGRYASRTIFCELVLNGEYRGVYVFMERIKRAQDRVNITKLTALQNAPPQISGGYIIKIDKVDAGDVTFVTDEGTRFIYVYPRSDRVTAAQRAWIRGYVTNFEASLRSPQFADPVYGYARYIDVDSFIDTYLLVQACRNIDGLRLSTYLYKDRDGRLISGPAWDYNISLGNANYYNGQYTNGWYDTGDGFPIPFWWPRFLQDTNFTARLRARWQALRKDVLHRTNFPARIDSIASALSEPQRRHFQRWPILGTYVWPNYYYSATSYVQEVSYLKQWASGRMSWMDGRWNTLIADFAASPLTTAVSQTVIFSNLSYGVANALQWQLGDGTTSSAHHPTHMYNTAGMYDVTLVISNYTFANGWSRDVLVRTNYLHVIPEPGMLSVVLAAWWFGAHYLRRHA